jgi:transcriptional regulator with XRE-family HTH domain
MSKEKARIFGRQVVAARGLLGMSQSELAELVGLTPTNLSKIETGQVVPHRSTIARLSDAIESRGVEFTNGANPGVRLKSPKGASPS